MHIIYCCREGISTVVKKGTSCRDEEVEIGTGRRSKGGGGGGGEGAGVSRKSHYVIPKSASSILHIITFCTLFSCVRRK